MSRLWLAKKERAVTGRLLLLVLSPTLALGRPASLKAGSGLQQAWPGQVV